MKKTKRPKVVRAKVADSRRTKFWAVAYEEENKRGGWSPRLYATTRLDDVENEAKWVAKEKDVRNVRIVSIEIPGGAA